MSSVNFSSKSGSKSCSSPEDYYEDELVNWLQYPLGDSMEKGYCSDLFGQWPPSSTVTAMPSTNVGALRNPAGGPVSMGTCLHSDNGSMSRSECATVLCESPNSDAKERVGNGSTLLRADSVDGALAMAAERAAGLVSLTGRDAFNKVRTSMQPATGSQLATRSLNTGFSDGSMQPRLMASHGALPSELLHSQLHSPSKPPQPLGSAASSPALGATMGGLATSFTSFKSRRSLSEAPIPMPSSQDTGCSRITDEMSVRRVSDHASSASCRGHACIAHASGMATARFASLTANGSIQRSPSPALVGTSERAYPSASGWSLSGTTLSTRETSSYSGKRKLDDSESQSEDVEGESSIDGKHPRKANSSSKRNRTAEVHNLSERNRRNRINEKLKALQDLIPNSTKTDKASVLDEAIEYMKTLQMQLQMVSLQSGLSVSPMMIPMGMPHVQMAPLHPVGLGVPIGHPGMGMGLHSMGMGGMMDMPQGMMVARPPAQSISPHFSVPSCQSRIVSGSAVDSCLDSTNMGSIPAQFMPAAPQNFLQIPVQMHPGFPTVSGNYLHQQHDQWQPSGHCGDPAEHYHQKQVGKEE